MIGESRQFVGMLAQLKRFASCVAPVLLEGETGTGKELAAREIHHAGPRRESPFVPVNCGALPDSLIESELFGHLRGAFTDAKSAQSGLVRRAQGGTLFLDEVDSLSPKAQVTLLRFLQDSEYRPVGGSSVRTADVRVIAAANASLQCLVAEGRFRRDLYYRLNALYVRVPALREREGDVALLAKHLLRAAARTLDTLPKQWTRAALAALEAYAWPGNVRELENVSLRACLATDGAQIDLADLERVEPAFAAVPLDAAVDAAKPLNGHAHVNGEGANASFSAAKTHAIESFEHDYLSRLMRRAHGNVSAAARLSSIERRQLGKLLKKRGIEKERFRSDD